MMRSLFRRCDPLDVQGALFCFECRCVFLLWCPHRGFCLELSKGKRPTAFFLYLHSVFLFRSSVGQGRLWRVGPLFFFAGTPQPHMWTYLSVSSLVFSPLLLVFPAHLCSWWRRLAGCLVASQETAPTRSTFLAFQAVDF